MRTREHVPRGGRETLQVSEETKLKNRILLFLAVCCLRWFRCSAPLTFNLQSNNGTLSGIENQIGSTMLRLIASYPLIPKKPHRVCNNSGKFGSYYDSSSIVRYGGIGNDGKKQQLLLNVTVKAVEDKGNNGGGSMSFSGQSWDPSSEIEVPSDQRPVNEYSSLKEGMLYSWGELGPSEFFIRLGGLWLVTFTVLGVPIAAASFNPSREPLRFALAAGTGTLFLVSLIVLRIYLGWSYVGDRLLSAVIPYEESGWYDGQMWVKPPEVLARDRLLGSYKVKPVIKMLKQTLVGTGALLVSAFVLFVFATPVEDFFKTTLGAKDNQTEVSVSRTNNKFNMRKEQLLRLPVDVVTDDDLAAAAAEAADGRPVYCRDRYYRALAGGQYCKWEDLVNK